MVRIDGDRKEAVGADAAVTTGKLLLVEYERLKGSRRPATVSGTT
jgi:hypothetical protein